MTSVDNVAKTPPVASGVSAARMTAATPGVPVVSVRALCKRYRRADGTALDAVRDVDLDVQPGEFLVLLGPSGCGKTTLLRSIAGLERPDSGRVFLGEQVVFASDARVDVPPEQRRLGMVFQSYALWPHMTVRQNVAYPLRNMRRRSSGRRINEAVDEVLGLVDISELAGQRPAQISGGQQQRVALARALVAGSNVVLFDEPLSNVDAKVRQQLRREIKAMQRRLGFAAIYVTHDQAEAMELADRVCVMRHGRILQVDTPRNIYDAPISRYVADFVGDINVLSATVVSTGEGRTVYETPVGEVVVAEAASYPAGQRRIVTFRPERCSIHRERPEAGQAWRATVESSVYLGAVSQHVVMRDEHQFRVSSESGEIWSEGDDIWLRVADEDLRTVAED